MNAVMIEEFKSVETQAEAESRELERVRSRLTNWVKYRRWNDGAWIGPKLPCSVLGSLFIAGNNEQRRIARPAEPDINDGYEVDQAVCSMSKRHRDVLMAKWLGWHWTENGARYIEPEPNKRHLALGMSLATYYRYINQSEEMLAKILLTREKNQRKKSINSDRMQ